MGAMFYSVADVLEATRRSVLEARAADLRVLELEGATGRRQAAYGQASTHSATTDGSYALIATIEARDRALRQRNEARRQRDDLCKLARLILYGRSGHGGMAGARGVLEADMAFCRYVKCMKWQEIAAEVERPDTTYAAGKWCRTRVTRAVKHAEGVGMRALVES